MKILQIMNRVPWPVKDGGALGFYNYILGYYDAGCEVTVCALNTSKHYFPVDNLPDELKKAATWKTVNVDTNLSIGGALRSLLTWRSYHVERFISSEFEKLLIKTITEHHFDVVVFEGLFTAYYVDIVRQHTASLLVLNQYNIEHQIWSKLAAGETNPLRKAYLSVLAGQLKRFEKKSLNKFDAVMSLTEKDRLEMQKLGCSKPVHVAPIGIRIKRNANSGNNTIPFSVFHLGSMEWLPNIHAMEWFLKEVWPKVVAKIPQAQFYLAGRKMPSRFWAFHSPNVRVAGEVENAETFMRDKRIMVVPLNAGSGIRVKILEGMTMGKAIVATSIGVQGIKCEHEQHLLVANTVDEFCHCLEQLLDNDLLCQTLGTKALKLVESEYNNKNVVEGILEFYRKQKA